MGTSYSYGDGNLPSWAITGEYGNGGASSSGRTEYIWLPTDDGNAIPVGMFRSNRFYSVHSDHLGTPRLIKDDAAKPVWQWSYSAFGDNKPTGILKATTNPNSAITNQPVLLNATNPAVVFNLRFPGQYFDSESGFFYNYHRSLMPGQDRYSQPDPIGLTGGWNRSVYANANALSFTDPDGLNPLTGAAGGAIAGPPGMAIGALIGTGIVLMSPAGQQAVQSGINKIVEFCTPGDPDPCKQLNDEVQAAKNKVGQLGACTAGMTRWALQERHSAWLNLATARAKRDQKCWSGGDAGHQQAQADAWSHVGRCSGLMK
ncbi:MAG: hypothetical protein HC765_10455 [Brachymonas sp.]|nr:hypothetical protein [Brachymonas sp.]